MGSRHWNLALAAAANVARNPRGPLVAASGLVVVLTLLIAGFAISEGQRVESLAALEAGPGVYCTWDVFGRDAAVPMEAVERLAQVSGVQRVVPRVVGRIELDGRIATVLGVPLAELQRADVARMQLDGSLPSAPHEVLVGVELAYTLGLDVGSTVALDAQLLRLFTVSGITHSTAPLWSAKAIVCDLAEAQRVFGDVAHVSDVCVYVPDGSEGLVAESIERLDRRFRVQTRELVAHYFVRGHALRGGTFAALFALALALAIPTFATLSHLGATPRRREIGLLKAEGWSTAEVLEMVALESVLIGLGVATLAFALAVLFVRGLGAPLLSAYFIADLGAFPETHIPARFTAPMLVAAVALGVTVTLSGSLWTTWRTARTRPIEVLR
jgi:ABC-type lipoprotein release transport system permease subunit